MAATNSAIVIPAPAPNPGTNDIRPLKDPFFIPNEHAQLYWILGIVAGVILLAVIVALVVRHLRKRARVRTEPPMPPHVRAKQKLREALALIADADPFCTAVSNVLRVYLEERFQFRAPDRTTEEFLQELQATNLLQPDQKRSLGEFLQSCDLVKFARLEPAEVELRALFDSAERLIDETAPHFTLNQPAADPAPVQASAPATPAPKG